MWAFIQAVLAVAMGAVGMRLYLLDFKGYKAPEPPPTKAQIDTFRKP